MLVTLVVMAFTAAVASAATVSGDGTLVGSLGNDTITAGNQMDIIWGRGGSDTITAGNGGDVIDAGGTCPAGLAAGDYPNGLPGTNYCSHGPAGTCGNTSITAGSGSDTIWGNCGNNTITVGSGKDTIFAFGGPNNKVTVGSASDTIFAYGAGTYTTGSGADTINAQYTTSAPSTFNCGSKHTTVFAVKGVGDTFNGCTVKFVSPIPPPPGQPLVKASTTAAAKAAASKAALAELAARAA
jgi:Ca2+-binding RTX toxin-like protein